MPFYCQTTCKVIILVVLTFLAYSSALQGGFVWDDEHLVTTHNPFDSSLKGLRDIWFEIKRQPPYYPLTRTAFWVQRRLWGYHPFGYHLVNVLLHVINALLLWRFLKRVKIPNAYFIAVVFAAHPICVESVAWVSELKNVMSGMFFLSSATAYILFEERPGHKRYYWLSFFLFVCALLTKTVTATLPLTLLILLWWKNGRIFRHDLLRVTPFLVGAFLFAGLTVFLEQQYVGAKGPDWDFSLAERFLIAGRAFWFYPVKLLWPFQLSFIYPRWSIDLNSFGQWLYPLASLMWLAVLWLFRRRMGRGPLAAVLFYFVTISPALGFIDFYPMRFSFVADHFQYLASLGWIVLFVSGAATWTRCFLTNARLRILLAIVLVSCLTVLSFLQGKIYKDVKTLYIDIISKNPGCAMAHNNLGVILIREGQFGQAEREFQLALQSDPGHIKAHMNLGVVFGKMKKYQEGLAMLKTALAIEPNPFKDHIHYNLAVLYKEQGDLQQAAQEWEEALKLNPALGK